MEAALLETGNEPLATRADERRPAALFILHADTVDLIYGAQERGELEQLAHFYTEPQTSESIARDPSLLAEVEVIFSGWGAPLMDEAFLARAPKLEAVFYGSGSVRSFTTEAFWRRQIALCSAYAANAEPVAEYTLATILLSLKKFWSFASQTRRGEGWGDHTRSVPGCFRSTVGLISFGMVARRAVELLRPFHLQPLVYCPFLSAGEAEQWGVERCALEEIFERSHVVSLHTPDLPETRRMVRGSHFAALQKDATFINTARGAVVDEEEMLDVLAARPDLTAVLDVCHPEPPPEHSRLRSLPNVVLTPHIAGSMGPECQRLGSYMVEEFKRYLRHEPLHWSIDETTAARLA